MPTHVLSHTLHLSVPFVILLVEPDVWLRIGRICAMKGLSRTGWSNSGQTYNLSEFIAK